MTVKSNRTDYRQRYCIVGAGTSGMVVAKTFAEHGLPFDCLEREDDIGGNWYYGKPHSSVYASTHLISSKRLTEYLDFPMPKEYPPFPSRQQVFDYLQAYARRFGLYDQIEFNTAIERIEPADHGNADDAAPAWNVTLADGGTRTYRGVVIANGHNWDPRWPELPGQFSGLKLHSSQYKTPDVLAGRRVLVVGGGNSGCDIAVESALHAESTLLSLRRGYHYLPKFLLGAPIDAGNEWMLRLRLPLWLRRLISGAMVRVAAGPPQRYGLPKPDHRLFETHPIINSQLLYYVGHGRVRVKPAIAELCGEEVLFADGTRASVDVLICATGFNITFPFIDREHLNWHGGRPELYLNVFHPRYDTLCVAGLIQPDSGSWGLVDYQARLIARYFRAVDNEPQVAERFRRRKAQPGKPLSAGIRYVDSPRHLLEVEHFSYRRTLEKQLADFP